MGLFFRLPKATDLCQRAKALLRKSRLLQLLKLSRRYPSHSPKLRRILAPSSDWVAPRARVGKEGVGPNPLMLTRYSTHGRFSSFLACLRARRLAARRLLVAVDSHHIVCLRPLDGQRGHPVRVFGETPSCSVLDAHQPECQKEG